MTDAGLLYTILACTMGLCAGPKPTQEQAIAAWNRRALQANTATGGK